MTPEQNIETVAADTLLEKVRTLKTAGHRLVQMCATTLPEHFEVLYCLDRDLHLTTLRVILPPEAPKLPSISGIYSAAVLYENEMHDLFHIEVEGMAVDFHGNFYQTAVKYPMGSKKVPAAAPPAREVPASAALVK